jgi:hypothetical protein
VQGVLQDLTFLTSAVPDVQHFNTGASHRIANRGLQCGRAEFAPRPSREKNGLEASLSGRKSMNFRGMDDRHEKIDG